MIRSVSRTCRIAGVGGARVRHSSNRPGHSQLAASPLSVDPVIDQLGDELEPAFWGHHLLHRRGRLAQDLDLVLELADASMGAGQLSGLATCQPQDRGTGGRRRTLLSAKPAAGLCPRDRAAWASADAWRVARCCPERSDRA